VFCVACDVLWLRDLRRDLGRVSCTCRGEPFVADRARGGGGGGGRGIGGAKFFKRSDVNIKNA
jgi:hypothetical protein